MNFMKILDSFNPLSTFLSNKDEITLENYKYNENIQESEFDKSHLQKMRSLMYYNISASMRFIHVCQLCKKIYREDDENVKKCQENKGKLDNNSSEDETDCETDIETDSESEKYTLDEIKGYSPKDSYKIGNSVIQYQCDGFTLLCSDCYNSINLKILDFLYLEGRRVYLDWDSNLNQILVQRSNGDIETNWFLDKKSPLKICEKYENEKTYLVLYAYCYNKTDLEKKDVSKWVSLDNLIELNPTLKLKVNEPTQSYLNEYKFSREIIEAIFNHYLQFKNIVEDEKYKKI